MSTSEVLRRRRQPLSPGVVFTAVFVVLSTAMLGYVVTNYGALFRLRLLAVTPLWMLPVMASAREAPRTDAGATS